MISCHPLLDDMYLDFIVENDSENNMTVLIWGVFLLGGIGLFVVWGLSNAYPTGLNFEAF